ncbi:MAG: TonB-dependent receptor [OM182 bacterium]|nr:MAG: TonB-dependent receptor [OM182 bacterium]
MSLRLGLGLVLTATAANVAAESTTIIEEQLVLGTRASLMSAIDKQEASDSIISVSDSDALGDFPDTTAAEAIRRLPGISIENDQGEGRYVTIRGLSSDLNAIAINGAAVMAPEGERSVLLDGVPTELLDSITVSKSLTPDQDADSIGGRIDFNTKNPSDIKDTLLKVKLDTTYNAQTQNANSPRLSLTYGGAINDKAAHVLGLTYAEKEIVTYNNETGFGWDDDGYMNDDWEMRYYAVTRERVGATYDFDYAVDDTTRLFMSAFWNEYTDDELRWKDEYGRLDPDMLLNQGMMSERVRHHAETRVRSEVRTIQAYTFGAETMLSGWNADFRVSYSFAEEDDSDNADVTFERDDEEFGGNLYWRDNEKPFLQSFDTLLRDPASMEFDELEIENSVKQDSETALAFNAEQEFDFGTLKFGGKFRMREVDVDNNKEFYGADLTLADFNPQTLPWPFPNQVFGQQADPSMIIALQDGTASLEFDEAETTVEDYITEEDVFALYGMGTFEVGQARIVAGLRYENVQTDSSAYDADGNATSASSDHSFWAPSINVKYLLSEDLVLRAAAWRSTSRPGFGATAPSLELEIDGEDISGSIGNPDLQPLEATNLDLALEFYGEGMTFASVGLFHKDIENAIYRTIQTTATINGISFNDGVETWINADDTTVTGLEANLQYGLDNGLFAALNVTHMLDNESTFQNGDDSTFTTPFRKLADNTANVSVGYDEGPWDIRLALSYRDVYLDWLADEEDDIDEVSLLNSRFVDEHMQLDLTIKYDYSDNLAIKLEAINIGNEPEFYYWGNSSRLSQYDEYGESYSVGVTYKL